jgi:hypothetical protein
VGVALLAEHEIAPALGELALAYPALVLDRSAALSERLLRALVHRGLDVAFVHQVPVLATLEGVEWQLVRRGRLAAMVSDSSALAGRESVHLSELSGERFLVPPRELAPSAVEGLTTMCATYGSFEPSVLELSTPLGADWRPVIEGEAVALMGEDSARAIKPRGTTTVELEPPPHFALAMAWRRGNDSPVLGRFLDFVRAYSDKRAWAAA